MTIHSRFPVISRFWRVFPVSGVKISSEIPGSQYEEHQDLIYKFLITKVLLTTGAVLMRFFTGIFPPNRVFVNSRSRSLITPWSISAAVIPPRRLFGHIPVGEILAQQCGVAARGQAVAAGARRLHHDASVCRDGESALAVERPPARPKGGVRLRSQHTAVCASWPSTRQMRRVPSPPRQVPAPPVSGSSAYSSTRSGKLISRISIGVFIILLTVLATALMPSLTGRAPNPPFSDS